MIISHKHKFIFIKTAKTAGTSIEQFLVKHCGSTDIITPGHLDGEFTGKNFSCFFNPFPEMLEYKGKYIDRALKCFAKKKPYDEHMAARVLRCRIRPEIWDDYFKFCVERNPWDKTVSHFSMLQGLNDKKLTFDQYLEDAKFCLNHPLYTDSRGKVIVDSVIKYENLNEQLSNIFSKLGIPFNSLNEKANAGFRKSKRNYQDYYDTNQREVIAKAFAKEIELFDYKF